MEFTCRQCGGEVAFQPGTENLTCPYCGSFQQIERAEGEIVELDFEAHLEQAAEAEEFQERLAVSCNSCGAETTFEANVTSDECPFCGTNIVVATHSTRQIKPKSLLPFSIDHKQAMASFKKWVRSRWFAPNKLKKLARTIGGLSGIYIPHWTYDCGSTSSYVGERGDDYYVNESYTTTENGRSVRRTRRVRRTRWARVSGVVQNAFDDVLVLASESLPRKYAERLEPWDLDKLVPYRDDYLSGFRAESYRVDLKEGFEYARVTMDATIRTSIRRDIGGAHQRIHSVETSYRDITFRHILLPVWLSAYRYKDKVYRFLVNARTGEVQGERPYSWVKIELAILAVVSAAALVIYLNQ
ncbi:MAG: hypothetical protein GY906_19410 [bacterium]|nr:hypothetical protein [bacterium]